MRAEIIAVGSELLLGDVINSNAAWLSKALAALGVDVFYHVTVGDNPARIQEVVETAVARSDVLIFTGGLGPTDDDLTVATLAQYFKTPLVEDTDSTQKIQRYFIARDMPMSRKNLKQALRPKDAETLENPIGTAPGILWDLSPQTGKTTLVITFPGVPKELFAMWPAAQAYLQQKLQAAGEQPQFLATRFLHFFGIGESKLGESLSDLMESDNPTVAPYVGKGQVRIRIAAKAGTEAEALKLIQPMKAEILRRCGAYYFGDDDTTLEQSVGQLLRESGQTVAVAESCTGGLVSSRLTDVPGSSDYIRLNLVTYANEAKIQQLGVSEDTLSRHGAVSPQVATEMALGIQAATGCTIGVGVTGIAGPDGATEDKPVGLVYIALCGLAANNHGEPVVHKVLVNPNYGRVDTKFWFSQYALYHLRRYLLGEE